MRKSLTLAACVALTLAACATTPPQQPPVAKAEKAATGCVPTTATRLPQKDSECAGFGASHSYKQLQDTGQPYADQELRMLDPSLWGGR